MPDFFHTGNPGTQPGMGFDLGLRNQQPPEQGFSIPSVYEQHPPHVLYLADQLAGRTNAQQSTTQLLDLAKQGIGPDQQDELAMQQQMQDLAARIARESQGLDDTQFKNLQARLEQEAMNAPTAPSHPQQGPNWAQAGLAALGTALFPNQGANVVSGTLAGVQQAHDRQYAQDLQDYQNQRQAHQDRLSILDRASDNERQAYNARAQRIQVMQNNLDKLQQQIQTTHSEKVKQKVSFLQRALDRYNGANTPGEKISAAAIVAKAAQDAGLPDYTIDQPTVDRDVATLNLVNTDKAKGLAKSETDRMMIDGEITPEKKARLDAYYRQLETTFGLPSGTLGEAETGQSLARKAYETKRDQWSLAFGHKLEKDAADLANKDAQLELARRRLDIAQQRADHVGMASERKHIATLNKSYLTGLKSKLASAETSLAALGIDPGSIVDGAEFSNLIFKDEETRKKAEPLIRKRAFLRGKIQEVDANGDNEYDEPTGQPDESIETQGNPFTGKAIPVQPWVPPIGNGFQGPPPISGPIGKPTKNRTVKGRSGTIKVTRIN